MGIKQKNPLRGFLFHDGFDVSNLGRNQKAAGCVLNKNLSPASSFFDSADENASVKRTVCIVIMHAHLLTGKQAELILSFNVVVIVLQSKIPAYFSNTILHNPAQFSK
jgi:hypothetical protein